MAWCPPLAPAGHLCHWGWGDKTASSFQDLHIEGWVERAAWKELRPSGGGGSHSPEKWGTQTQAHCPLPFWQHCPLTEHDRKPEGKAAL